jgi:hypothetical protein
VLNAGLPDGLFPNQKYQLGKFWRSSDWKKIDLFYDHFMAIWNILQTFWICYGHFVHFVLILVLFSSVGIMDQEKSGNTG